MCVKKIQLQGVQKDIVTPSQLRRFFSRTKNMSIFFDYKTKNISALLWSGQEESAIFKSRRPETNLPPSGHAKQLVS